MPKKKKIRGAGLFEDVPARIKVLTDEGVVVVSSGEVSLLDTARHS